MAQYVDWLCQEIRATPKEAQPLRTVFFGGGTPSLLSVEQVITLLATLQDSLNLTATAEISMEMDPGTFTLAQLQGFCDAGVNRISLGVQAFQDELLQVCGRTHTVAQIEDAIAMVRETCGNFSLDLISGLPGQTLAQWEESLRVAIASHPTHISTYDLVLEPTTVFGKRYQPGSQPLPTDDHAAQMYRLASQRLSATGYRHYEVSNYARPSFECRHNQVYWQNEAYYGFGMGATSYVNFQRFSRPRTREAYFTWVQSLVAAQGQIDCPVDTLQDRLLETLMLGLRLADGLQIEPLQQQFGSSSVARILDCLRSYPDWVAVDSIEGRVRLTDPEGFLFSNQVLVALWEALSDNEQDPSFQAALYTRE
ncbi:Oxygen-independent coproporphyrinogen-III oxidase-like protein [Acaryochloris thomasi RCC1774]|uniref:Heme chaperone HemW n=2 Tax=Acaryochloris TaxID=155977 RepID=A0A2W1K645_9CYAN|nr:Oxygen-independent coproporphyrinogen-III oxidase-like protein [Acaryochloris thomasi RCC1774]